MEKRTRKKPGIATTTDLGEACIFCPAAMVSAPWSKSLVGRPTEIRETLAVEVLALDEEDGRSRLGMIAGSAALKLANAANAH